MGETVAAWDEWDGDERVDVDLDEIEAVLRTQEEYDAWLEGLPLSEEAVAQLTTDVDLGEQVAVTGAHLECFSYLALLTDGDGGVDTADAQRPADEGTACESSPVRIAVVVATLDELGVASAEDVDRDTAIGGAR